MFTPPRPPREFLLADDGAATVEYVICLLTGAVLAGALYAIVNGEDFTRQLKEMLDKAMSVT